MSMLLRLWQAERPRAVVVGWDTLFVPTYRNGLLETYQSGREFDPEIVEQLACCRRSSRPTGIVCGKQEGFEADDFLAAAVAGERARGGTTLVATSDRDAYQLAAADVTILQPVARRQRAGPDRAGGGARALRRRPGAGVRLHRAARRSVGQDPRRARDRREDRGDAAATIPISSR